VPWKELLGMLASVLFKCDVKHPEIELADAAIKAGSVYRISGE
jgi:hypothetical protein